ncbi:MAG: transposase [Acidobacteriota bacterium]
MAELNAEYIARMEDVLALYEKPLAATEPVLLHADVRPPRPMRPGKVTRRDCEYQRRGTANAFCGVEPKAGRHFTKVTPKRSAPQFADYLLEIVAAYPQAGTIHVVMDNLSSHRRKPLVDRYGERIGGCYGIARTARTSSGSTPLSALINARPGSSMWIEPVGTATGATSGTITLSGSVVTATGKSLVPYRLPCNGVELRSDLAGCCRPKVAHGGCHIRMSHVGLDGS